MKKNKLGAALLSAAMTLSIWSGVPASMLTANAATANNTAFNNTAKNVVEYLDRGISAVNTGSGMLVSWRFLASDPDDAEFRLYRGNEQVYTSTSKDNSYTKGATCFLDKGGNASSVYRVDCYSGGKKISSDTCKLTSNTSYFDIKLSKPGSGYTPNDMSVGDVDGDGQYELFLKWDPNNSKDNSQKGKTGNVFIDCYRLDGTRLWRIDLGVNIRAGAHYTQFYVADYDLDGKAEMTCKTSDGTKDGTGKVIGDGSKNYVNGDGLIITGNEFYTLFDGLTGAALDTINYEPGRGDTTKWGKSSDKFNRVDRFWGTTAYLDGVHPCVVTGRGYYGRMTATAYKVENKKLVKMWAFDSGTSSSAQGYGDGNHNSMAADVDNDGKQEIITGATCIDDNGKVLWCANTGHGDAMHVGDLDPSRAGIEVWTCHEDKPYGVTLFDGRTGTKLLHKDGSGDTGRCCADNVWAGSAGAELWGNGNDVYDPKGNNLSCRRPAINFLSYWDGDLEREILDGYTDSPATITDMTADGKLNTLLTTDGYYTCNTTKGTPCLSADIFGDWREELIVRAASGDGIRIYTTTIDTDYRVQCLMHDPQYRVQVSAQNTAYNQPPHTSFFLGTGYEMPARPLCTVNGGGTPVNFGKDGAALSTAQTYTIRNANSGMYLTLDTANANNVIQSADGVNTWTLAEAGDGYYRIYSTAGDGKTYLLDLDYGKTENGTNIQAFTDTENDAQLFKFVACGDGSYQICTKNTTDESCIGVTAASKEEGANVIQWACGESADQKWIMEINANFVKHLGVQDAATAASWTFDKSLVQGDTVFCDRDFTYTALPTELLGAEAILTACNSKNYDAVLGTFQAAVPLTVYIALDSRQTEVPAWLSAYTRTDLTGTTSNDVTFHFYKKDFAKGETVTLGTNGGSYNLVNYTAMVKSQPVPGNALIKDALFHDCERYAAYSVQDAVRNGDPMFGDRDVTFAELPAALEGASGIRTACDSKNLDAPLVTFTAGADETVYVALDARVETVPAWLSAWENTGMTCKNSNDVTFNLYSKKAAAGESVTLGTNGQAASCVNYAVLVQAASAEVTTEPPTEPETVPPTEPATEPTTPPATEPSTQPGELPPASMYGDANCDGVVDIVDVIALNKNLMIGTPLSPQGIANSIVGGDNSTLPSETDALNILKYIVRLVKQLPVN